jgi:hypothetical protein
VWHHPGRRVPVRWVLVRDVTGEHDSQAFLVWEVCCQARFARSFLFPAASPPPSSRAFAGTHAEAWVERPLTTFHPA